MRYLSIIGVGACALLGLSSLVHAQSKSGYDTALAALKAGASVGVLERGLATQAYSSVELTQAALFQISSQDKALHAVIIVNPEAIAAAKASDASRRAGEVQGPLAGIPVLIKDNIETLDEMATTAGSLALKDNVTHRDAPVIARLRAGGAIILGKTNLSEWANIRSTRSVSGWSGVGGLVVNPFDHARTACGSSSGSGAALAAYYAPVAIGTETDGSVTCPSSMNGLVGLKPTVGLVSRTFVVPISHTQDTPGPMAHNVEDVAALLTVMAGSDPADPATKEADSRRGNYQEGLMTYELRGVRIGVLRDVSKDAKTNAVFEKSLQLLAKKGAVLVDISAPEVKGLGDAELSVMLTELKADLNHYLASTPSAVKTRTLADVIAFNRANAAAEMPYFEQELFEQADATKGLDDPAYVKALNLDTTASADRLDGWFKTNQVAFVVAPTYGPAWMSDVINGDQYSGPSATTLPATAGYPHLTVPMGTVQGMPVGLSFIGPKWSERLLLQAGYAFEQARKN